ncbi:Asp-tRNA(Asn)/Glu-tRNA(Gln) amidotransferase subunit GatA [Anaplasmataceae bacterium AB001_6]|nr:Asp-tRNA(Asn)/Glu-tRNA(Gln) amidotransferase subunit GatA [Anaplasmataceae bacterium AB001_6]
MNSLCHLTITEMATGLRKKSFSSVDLVNAHLKMIKKFNSDLNAYVTITEDYAIEQAKKADEMFSSNSSKITNITGIPIGIKDLFCTKGVRTTACSQMLEDFVPQYESTVTKRIFEAGAVMLGKTNMDEFAMGSGNLYSYFGKCINPWNTKDDSSMKLVPGGSSGGSASATASFMCAAATGSDTGGSIRQPASFCGVLGLKPTYGRFSRWGMISFASSLDQAGIFARDVKGLVDFFQVIAGYDEKDPTTSRKTVPCMNDLQNHISGLKIGVPFEYFNYDGLSDEVANAWKKSIEHVKKLGANIVDVNMTSMLDYALPAYYLISSSEASSNLARYDGIRYGKEFKVGNLTDLYTKVRSEYFGEEVKRRLMIGTYVLSYCDKKGEELYGESQNNVSFYSKACFLREKIVQDFHSIFKEVDVLLLPSSPGEAFGIEQDIPNDLMYLNDSFTVPISLAGLPSVSFPYALSNKGLPLGLQFVTKHFAEQTLFDCIFTIEQDMEGKLIDLMKKKYTEV